MRLSDDVRKSVVFIGFPDGKGGMQPVGTAFLIWYKESTYIVTNQHIAAGIGDAPYALRVNKRDGTSDNVLIDPITDGVRWYSSDDENVDLAVMPFNYDLRARGYEFKIIPSTLFVADSEALLDNCIGVGDMCYVVGLFRLMSGRTKNLPFVHSGNIALMPGEEKIPVRDWLGPAHKNRYVDAFLVEITNLKGLSGSPVFVRPTLDLTDLPTQTGPIAARLPRRDIFLLGVWQGSWDASPDEVMAIEHGDAMRVPVGIGIVVPASKLVELLEIESLQTLRYEFDLSFANRNAAAVDTEAS